MTYEQQQKKFDIEKWQDSEKAGHDMCGSYEFCGLCDKKLTNPCARAARKHGKAGAVRIAVVQKKRTAK